MNAAVDDAQGTYAITFIANAHAPITENASGGVVIDDGREGALRLMVFDVDEAAFASAVLEDHVL